MLPNKPSENKIEEFKNSFLQRFGGDFNERYLFCFDSQKELLNNPWLKSFSEMDEFYRFSISKVLNVIYLILETNGGNEFWVMGYLKNLEGINLPEFKKHKDIKNT